MPYIPQPEITLLKTHSITQCHDNAENSQDKFYKKVKPFMVCVCVCVYIYSKTICVVNVYIVKKSISSKKFGSVNENFDMIEKLLNMMSVTSTT